MNPYYHDAASGITIYCGDAREVLPQLDLAVADHLITDPPYGVSGEHSDEHRKDGSLRRLNFEWDTLGDADLSQIIDLSIARLRKPSNAIVWCSHAQAALIDERFILDGRSTKPICWVKQCPPPSFGTTRWASGFEIGVFGFHPGATWNLRSSGLRPNVIVADALRHGNPERTGHETQKPLNVMLWAMAPICAPGQIILDPFMGSGTTLVAAKRLGCARYRHRTGRALLRNRRQPSRPRRLALRRAGGARVTSSLTISRQIGQSFYLDELRVTLRGVVNDRVKLAIDSTPPIEAWCDTRLSVQIGESYIVVSRAGVMSSKVRLSILAPKSVKVLREEIAGVGQLERMNSCHPH